jgi:hypothetical protein
MRPFLLLVCAGVACTSPPSPEPAPTAELAPTTAAPPATDAAVDATRAAAPVSADAGPAAAPVGAVAMVVVDSGYLVPMVCARAGSVDHGDACMEGTATTRVIHGHGLLGFADPGDFPIDCGDDEPGPIERPAMRLIPKDRARFPLRTLAVLPDRVQTIVELPNEKRMWLKPVLLEAIRGALHAKTAITADQAFEMDLDGDGAKELVLAVSAGGGGAAPNGLVALITATTEEPFEIRRIGPWRDHYGARSLWVLGATDLDRDGLLELIVWEYWKTSYYLTSFELGSARFHRVGCGSV